MTNGWRLFLSEIISTIGAIPFITLAEKIVSPTVSPLILVGNNSYI